MWPNDEQMELWELKNELRLARDEIERLRDVEERMRQELLAETERANCCQHAFDVMQRRAKAFKQELSGCDYSDERRSTRIRFINDLLEQLRDRSTSDGENNE